MKDIIGNPAFRRLFVLNFLFFSSLNVINVIPDWLVSLGASKTYVGIYMNINSLALVLLVIPLSHFTDRIGRRILMHASFALGILMFALMVPFARDLVMLALLRSVGSLAFCAGFTVVGVEAFEILPRERRVAGMAILGISGLLSNPTASFVGERLLVSGHPELIFAAGGLFLLGALATSWGHRYHRPDQSLPSTPFLELVLRPRVLPLAILAMLMGGAFSVYGSFLANLSRERLGEVSISVFFSAFSAVAIASRLFLANRMDRISPRLLATGSFALIAASFALSPLLVHTWVLIPMGFMYGLGHSILFPLVSTLFVNSGSAGEKLGLNNIFASVNTMGNIVWALAMGVVADLAGLGTVFLTYGVVALGAAVLAFSVCIRTHEGQSPVK